MLSADLRAIYERAVYEVELETGWVSFRIHEAVREPMPAQTLAVVTAWNPADLRPERAVNERANARLAAEIEASGHRAIPALGRSADGTHAEPSFAITAISQGEAIALGRRYAQAAVFYWDGNEAFILSCFD